MLRPVGVVVLAALASALTAAPPPLTAAQAGAIDAFVQQTMKARRIPGVAVAVLDGNSVVYKKAFGVSNLESATPLTTDSVFELASITKQFTAAAIMMLADEGKVELDAPIATYLPNLPPAWPAITVRHLLTHTSGLFAGGIVQHDRSPLLEVTTDQAFKSVTAQRAFPPGTAGFYSDSGYFLLGMIIEKASGQTYRTFLQRRIFEPLQMTHSSLTDRRRVIPGRVATYEIADGALVNWRRDWDYELPSFFGIWSTLDDVAKWDVALRKNTLLAQRRLDEMWTPGRLNDGRDALVDERLYGFGFRLGEIRGRRVVSHTGASGTLLLHVLDEPLTVIVFTNLSNTAGRHGTSLGHGILGLVRAAYTPIQKLAPATDPAPERSAALLSLLNDVAAGRDSPLMTPAHAEYFRRLPNIARDPVKARLAGLSPLSFITCDEVEGKGIRITEPIARICHYKTSAAGREIYVTFWLTSEGKAAHLRLQNPDDY